jgi:hypothetical protein
MSLYPVDLGIFLAFIVAVVAIGISTSRHGAVVHGEP